MATGVAIGLLGFLNGGTEPNAGGRSNEIHDALGGSDAFFSLGWAGWPFGMWLASNVGGWLLERIGGRNLLLGGALLYWAAFGLIGQVSTPVDLFWVMLLVGVGNGFFDVAYFRISPWFERQKQRLEGGKAGFLNQIFMGLFSMGSVVAALVAWLATGLDISVAWHLTTVSVVALGVTVGWAVWKLPNLKASDEESYDSEATGKQLGGIFRRLRSTPWELRRTGIVGFCAALPIGIGYVWAAIYLVRLGADEWAVPIGLVAFLAPVLHLVPASVTVPIAPIGAVSFTASEMAIRMMIGRLSKEPGGSSPDPLGRKLTASLRLASFQFVGDPVKLTRIGGVVALVGIALIVVPATIPLAILGFALLGGGLAPVGGFVTSAAPRIWEAHKGLASGLVTRYVYFALVGGPVFIGPMSSLLGSAETATPLRIALGSTAVLPLTVILMAGAVRRARIEDAT